MNNVPLVDHVTAMDNVAISGQRDHHEPLDLVNERDQGSNAKGQENTQHDELLNLTKTPKTRRPC